MDPDNLLTKVQSNPLAHELSNDIRKCGVLEALKHDDPACYAVSGEQLEHLLCASASILINSGSRSPTQESYRRSLAKLPGLAPGDLNLAAVIELNV
jgi:hypothetical protein